MQGRAFCLLALNCRTGLLRGHNCLSGVGSVALTEFLSLICSELKSNGNKSDKSCKGKVTMICSVQKKN